MTGEDAKGQNNLSDGFRFYDRCDLFCWFFNEYLKMNLWGIWFVYFIFAFVLTAFTAYLNGTLFPNNSAGVKGFFEDWEWIIGHGIFAPIAAVLVASFCKRLTNFTNEMRLKCLEVSDELKLKKKLELHSIKLSRWIIPLIALAGAVAYNLWVVKSFSMQNISWNSWGEDIAFWYPRATVVVNYYLAFLLAIKLFYVNTFFLSDIMTHVKLKPNYPDRRAGLGLCGKWFLYTATCVCWWGMWLLDLRMLGVWKTTNPMSSPTFLISCVALLCFSLIVIFYPMFAIHKRMKKWKERMYLLLEENPNEYFKEVHPKEPIPDPISLDVKQNEQNLINEVSEWPINLKVGIVTQVVLPIIIAWGPWIIDKFILKRPMP